MTVDKATQRRWAMEDELVEQHELDQDRDAMRAEIEWLRGGIAKLIEIGDELADIYESEAGYRLTEWDDLAARYG